jgi:signal transduction histidine kinase
MIRSFVRWVVLLGWLLPPLLAQPLISLDYSQTARRLDTLVDYARIPQQSGFASLDSLSLQAQVTLLNRRQAFRRAGPQGLQFGTANDNFLFRFRLRRPVGAVTQWRLVLTQPSFVDAVCYVVDADGQTTAMRTDVGSGTGQTYLYGPYAAWPVVLADTRPVTVYLLCMGGDVPKHFPLTLTTTDDLPRITSGYALFWGGYFGLMVALFLYNLLIFWSVRDRNYLFYCLLLFSHALFQLKNSGYGLRFVWWDWPLFSAHAPVLIGGVSFFAGLSFSIVFLDTRRFAPRLYPVMVVVAGQYLVMSLLVVSTNIIGDLSGLVLPENYWIMAYFVLLLVGALAVDRWGGARLAFLRPFARVLIRLTPIGLVLTWLGEVLGPFSIIGLVSAVTALVLCVWAGVAAWQAGNPNARFYLLAWFSVLLALAVYIVYLTGIWPYSFGLANDMAFGTAGEALLFALALANRINLARRDREHALTELVQQLTVNQQQQQRLQNIRNDMARDLHDDIGSSLGSIGILSQTARALATDEPDRAQALLDRIGQTARQVMEAMSDLVWSVNPNHDPLARVLDRMRDFGQELFTDTGTAFVFRANDLALPDTALADKRRHLFLIYKEALLNSAKYARANTVTVTVQQTDAALTLGIRDDGCGFAPGQQQDSMGGNGLTNMHLRAADLGGQLRIEAAPGQGTFIFLTVPV